MAQSRCRSIFMSITTLLSSFWCVRAFIDQEGVLVALVIFLALQLLSYRSRGRSSSSSSTIEMACSSSIQSSSSSALMACSSIQSSSSSALMTRNYDVFVSFRGDTRNNFTDHLFGALQRKHIVAFRDDTKIQKGESLEPELLRAIEGSLVYVVVFSENYASSTWCLRELEYILECVQVSGKRVLPIFYDVDPSQVRYQKGKYAEAFAKHEKRFKQDKVQNWRAALKQVADLSGWDMRHKPQCAEIEKVVEKIINILGRRKLSSLPKDIVGIYSPIQELENRLLLDSVDDVRVVGISGISGIGKSTLVAVLYGKISHQFDACCFIDDVSKIYTRDGPIGALQQIIHEVLREERHQICNLYDAAVLMQSRLCRVRALIILDNVDQCGQLEKLALLPKWLGAGSRIVITSRNEHILKVYGVNVVYKVPLLNHANSLELFCRKAFKCDNIMSGIMSDYERLANNILDYAGGLPLAIEVLGSFLFDKDMSEWRSALARLKESPNKDIMDVLRLSFDGLEKTEKDIFLDIACFFVDKEAEVVKHILNCCGFHPDIGLKVLIDKSLISISVYRHGIVNMHCLLQKLGKNIVQENSKNNPRKWSRLWCYENLDNVMRDNMEENVEAMVLHGGEGKILMGETLSKMSHLRLLILDNVDLLGNLDCLSNELRYVHLDYYPFEYLPSSFHPNQLVDLQLQYSKMKQLWKGKKGLPNLRIMDLSHSRNLIMMPDFSEFPNLERLNLERCEKLEHLGPSNDVPRKLVFLNLKDCKKLSSIPNNIFVLSSLRDLNISGCSKAVKILKLFPEFQSMRLPFHSLRELDVSFCGLTQIPDAIGCLHCLEILNLRGNKFVTLPSLKKLSKLVYLNLEHCKELESLTELPSPKIPSPATTKQYFPLFLVDEREYRRRRGVYIFNCPVLGERERCSSMISSWMIQFIWANQQPSTPFCYVDTIIPGSEIPRWFKNQSPGSSRIWVDSSPIMRGNANDVIGFAYCAVFHVTPGTKRRGFTNLKIRFCREDYGKGGFNIWSPVVINSDLITVNSTHIWLIYFPLESFSHSVSWIGMSPGNLDGVVISTNMGNCSFVKVMNHGYNWVSKKDLQMMHGGNSFALSHNFLATPVERRNHTTLSCIFLATLVERRN